MIYKPSPLIFPDGRNISDVFGRLFGRYFLQIFDLRTFWRFHIQFIQFSFYVRLRASFWPFWPPVLFLWLSVRFSRVSVLVPADCVRNPRNFVRFRPGNGRIGCNPLNQPCVRDDAGKQALQQQRFVPLKQLFVFPFRQLRPYPFRFVNQYPSAKMHYQQGIGVP